MTSFERALIFFFFVVLCLEMGDVQSKLDKLLLNQQPDTAIVYDSPNRVIITKHSGGAGSSK